MRRLIFFGLIASFAIAETVRVPPQEFGDREKRLWNAPQELIHLL